VRRALTSTVRISCPSGFIRFLEEIMGLLKILQSAAFAILAIVLFALVETSATRHVADVDEGEVDVVEDPQK
jgi:hypothetical protein